MDIKILVATHKKYQMPTDDIYMPIHVGKEGKEDLGFIGDNTGDNISERNARLCELTGTYWAWKNLDADFIGLVHYRRHFTFANKLERIGKNKFSIIANREQLEKALQDCDVLVPNKRKYYIETMESHHLHLPYTYEKDYRIFERVIHEVSPEYEQSFKKVMNGTSAHMFNMFIMKKELFDQYCKWMFKILLETDKRIDVKEYNRMQARAVGYFGEFMLDVWLDRNNVKFKEVDVIFMEKQNWAKKIVVFVLRKYRYKNSDE